MSKDNGKDKGDGFENVDGKAPETKGKKASNAHLPGMEPKTIPSVHRAIEEYVEVRDQRMGLTKIETEKKAHLMTVMKKHDITTYCVDGHEATLETDETVKARLRDAEAEEDEPKELRVPKGRKGRVARAGAEA